MDTGFFCPSCGTVATPGIMACRTCNPDQFGWFTKFAKDYDAIRKRADGIYLLTHYRHGLQIWTSCKVRKFHICHVTHASIKKGDIAFRPVTNLGNRMNRISVNGMEFLMKELNRMKIRLTKDLKVEPKHRMFEGRELWCEIRHDTGTFANQFWITTDANEEMQVWPHEFEEVKDDA